MLHMNHTLNGSKLTINLAGKFTFSASEDFKKLLDYIRSEDIKTINFQMEKLEFVDSAALGMLLLVRDEAEKHNIKIALHDVQGQPEQMFRVSNFDKLFTMN
jgi:anti-anti-sigma factor